MKNRVREYSKNKYRICQRTILGPRLGNIPGFQWAIVLVLGSFTLFGFMSILGEIPYHQWNTYRWWRLGAWPRRWTSFVTPAWWRSHYRHSTRGVGGRVYRTNSEPLLCGLVCLYLSKIPEYVELLAILHETSSWSASMSVPLSPCYSHEPSQVAPAMAPVVGLFYRVHRLSRARLGWDRSWLFRLEKEHLYFCEKNWRKKYFGWWFISCLFPATVR